ncbi:MAG: DUF1836 domain-containing protein [Candidatus Avilachnospira sp.]|jgi:hypothetical protein
MSSNDRKLHELLRFLDTLSYIKPEQIPSIDLYMDQVTSLMEERLKKVKRHDDDKVLTKTMINNYAKAKILPAPDKKKYSKEHMFILLFIYYYKSVLSLSDIATILDPLINRYFKNSDGLNVEDIYKEAFNMEYSQMNVLKNDIKEKFKLAKQTFSEDNGKIAALSEEDREELRLFSFICELSFDVYLKKLIIEKLCDSISEESRDRNKKSK